MAIHVVKPHTTMFMLWTNLCVLKYVCIHNGFFCLFVLLLEYFKLYFVVQIVFSFVPLTFTTSTMQCGYKSKFIAYHVFKGI